MPKAGTNPNQADKNQHHTQEPPETNSSLNTIPLPHKTHHIMVQMEIT